MLDAFDFFIMAFVLREIAAFSVPIRVAFSTTVRPAAARGAFLFGRLADWFGSRPTLMITGAMVGGIALAHCTGIGRRCRL